MARRAGARSAAYASLDDLPCLALPARRTGTIAAARRPRGENVTAATTSPQGPETFWPISRYVRKPA